MLRLHRQLIYRKLAVGYHLVCSRWFAGFQIDHPQSTIFIALHSVNLSCDHQTTDFDLKLLLGRDKLTGFRKIRTKCSRHVKRFALLAALLPAGFKLQGVPVALNEILKLRLRGRNLQGRVQQSAKGCFKSRSVATKVLNKPVHRALLKGRKP